MSFQSERRCKNYETMWKVNVHRKACRTEALNTLPVYLIRRLHIITKRSLSFDMSVCLSVCLHVTARLPLGGFWRKFILVDLYENLLRNYKFCYNLTKIRHFTWRPSKFYCYRRHTSAINTLLCIAQDFYTADSVAWLNNTHWTRCCFSVATKVRRRCNNVASYIHCLSCITLAFYSCAVWSNSRHKDLNLTAINGSIQVCYLQNVILTL